MLFSLVAWLVLQETKLVQWVHLDTNQGVLLSEILPQGGNLYKMVIWRENVCAFLCWQTWLWAIKSVWTGCFRCFDAVWKWMSNCYGDYYVEDSLTVPSQRCKAFKFVPPQTSHTTKSRYSHNISLWRDLFRVSFCLWRSCTTFCVWQKRQRFGDFSQSFPEFMCENVIWYSLFTLHCTLLVFLSYVFDIYLTLPQVLCLFFFFFSNESNFSEVLLEMKMAVFLCCETRKHTFHSFFIFSCHTANVCIVGSDLLYWWSIYLPVSQPTSSLKSYIAMRWVFVSFKFLIFYSNLRIIGKT